jgi:hypothetical protein
MSERAFNAKERLSTQEWKGLSPAKMRDYLLEHLYYPDSAYTDEKRLEGENRQDFVKRVFKEKKQKSFPRNELKEAA